MKSESPHLIIGLLMLTFLSTSCLNKEKADNRELLQEYFLYSCIKHGFNDSNFLKEDHSGAVYFDMLKYNLDAIQKVDSVAKSFVENIKPSTYEGRNTKGIIILSIEKSKSADIKDYIISLDKYMFTD
jgi:hypothetical protein